MATVVWHNHRTTSLEEHVFVLASCSEEGDRAALRRTIETCAAHASKALGAELRVGIGHQVGAPEDLALARRSAEDCLAFSAGGGVVGFEEIRDEALLGDVENLVGAWRGGHSPAYCTLLELDAANGTEYVHTLRCLLEAFGNVAVAAERLHLHVNTVRYRLKRIEELTGVDFEDGRARLALELELRSGS
jgi:DNA-binding PucR family transcriptional regulator